MPDYNRLDKILQNLQSQILNSGVIRVISSIEGASSTHTNAIKSCDLDLILRYSDHFYTPLRKLAVLCLKQSDAKSRESDYFSIVSAALSAGLYRDVLELIERKSITQSSLVVIAIQASYKLALWPKVLEYASRLSDSALSLDLKIIIIRSHLELGSLISASSLLEELGDPLTLGVHQVQVQVLELLIRHHRGELATADLARLLRIIPIASLNQCALLASIFPSIEAFLTTSELGSTSLSLVFRQFWQTFYQLTILYDGPNIIPPLQGRSSIENVAILSADARQAPIYESLLEALKTQSSNDLQVYLLCTYPINTMCSSRIHYIQLSDSSPSSMLRQVRGLHLDVIIDTVGTNNPRLLEMMTQKAAPLQLGWFVASSAIFHSSHYNALIVDRWNKPNHQLYLQTGLLEVSGCTTLSHPDLLPTNQFAKLQAAENESLQILVLGSPSMLLPGSALFLHQIYTQFPDTLIVFVDPLWSEPGLLNSWWSSQCVESVPTGFRMLGGIQNIQNLDSHRTIGLSLNSDSPVVDSLHLLSLGSPIACIASELQGIQPLCGLLQAIGLQAFIARDPSNCLEILNAWMLDPTLRTEISETLPKQVESSLLMNIPLFASDLLEGIRLLEDTL